MSSPNSKNDQSVPQGQTSENQQLESSLLSQPRTPTRREESFPSPEEYELIGDDTTTLLINNHGLISQRSRREGAVTMALRDNTAMALMGRQGDTTQRSRREG